MARKLLISIILLIGIIFLVGCRTNKNNIDTSVDTDKQVTNTPSPDDTDTPDMLSDSEDKSQIDGPSTTSGTLLLAFTGVGENRRYGYIDEEGSNIIEPQYTLASDFNDGRAVVDDNGRKLVIDQEGNTIYEGQYDIEDYQNGLATIWDSVEGEFLKGFIDIYGNVIISPRYKEASGFDEKGKAYVSLEYGFYGIIDKKGELLESYEIVDGDRYPVELVDGYIIYSYTNTGLLGVMDYKGTLIGEPKYGRIQYLGNDIFAVYELDEDNYVINYTNPAALMNSKGEELSDFIFHDISYFNNGYASATNSRSTYFIDERGNVAEDLPQFEGRGTLELV
ncbi:MAG TPA: WG repeat-containing protein, partial [Clostridiales bacterium]|nr:WG repeat-containing protein [Clostridiales bacterium]